MKTLVNWDPMSEVRNFESWFDRMFAEPLPNFTPDAFVALPVDVYERDNRLFVKAAVPGVEAKDLEITVENHVLTIRGETKHEKEMEDARVYRREYRYGTFARSVRLPDQLDLEKVDAEFKNGFVTITIPRIVSEKETPKKIVVREPEVSKK